MMIDLVRGGETQTNKYFFIRTQLLTTLFILIITYVFHRLTLAMSTVFTSELYLLGVNWNEQLTFIFFCLFYFEIKKHTEVELYAKPWAPWTVIFFEYFFFDFIYVHHTLNWTPFLALLLVIYFTWFVT